MQDAALPEVIHMHVAPTHPATGPSYAALHVGTTVESVINAQRLVELFVYLNSSESLIQ
jgi:hypothetical protein